MIPTSRTARFVITGAVAPEEDSPEDHFQFQEDIDSVRNGDVAWFVARVQVATRDGIVLGNDYLGGCAYASVDEFFRQDGGYFSDMVHEACHDARRHRAAIPFLRVNR